MIKMYRKTATIQAERFDCSEAMVKYYGLEDCGGHIVDGLHVEIKKGSKWYWNPGRPDYMWRDDPNIFGFITNIKPEGRDSDHFKLTGVHRENG